MRYLLELVPEIKAAWYCTDFEGENCFVAMRDDDTPAIASWWSDCAEFVGSFRKPNPGMLLGAMRHYGYEDAIMIGDRPEDEQAAVAAGIAFIHVNGWLSGGICLA